MDDLLAGPDEARAAEVAAIEAGSEADRNERRLHAVIAAHAAGLPAPSLRESRLFRGLLMGGFECSSHRRQDRRRLDLLASTGHAEFAAEDYRGLARYGIRTVRDGLRWHLIERVPGRYDWSSFLPMLHAAREAGTEVIWDLCHYGWPDWLNIWAPGFVDRFAAFAAAAARLVRDETDGAATYVPVNEISYWAWAGGSLGYINPHAKKRGTPLKVQLIRAAIAAVEAIRAVDPRARIAFAEPAIHVIPKSDRQADVRAARGYTDAQFEALDFLTGRSRPELGGRADYVDIVGLNYYLHNQWIDGGLPMALDHPKFRPLRDILAAAHSRYGKPVFLAETGIEGDLRGAWLRIMATEVAAAQAGGVPVEGICLYPVTDYPGWVDARHCPTGLLGFPDTDGARPVFEPLARELALLGEQLVPAA
jgi:beta-glucosidase/6-phospho-beta-glucosidase/beta-galactosidase